MRRAQAGSTVDTLFPSALSELCVTCYRVSALLPHSWQINAEHQSLKQEHKVWLVEIWGDSVFHPTVASQRAANEGKM